MIFGFDNPAVSDLALSGLDGIDGFRINGEAAGDSAGYSVSGGGDINGDGFDDLIIGAPDAEPATANLAGVSYVVFGKGGGFGATLDLAALTGGDGFQITGLDVSGGQNGISVGIAGDVNGDGFDDLIVGAQGDLGPLSNGGQSYLIYGTDSAFGPVFGVSGLDGENGLRINGAAVNDFSGHGVAGAGDVNGDGFDDLVIGAFFVSKVSVVFGANFRNEGSAPASLTATGADQRLVGGLGDDTLDSGGFVGVVLRGGNGDDILVFYGAERRVVGGGGEDTLRLGVTDQELDLTSLPSNASNRRITGIEHIDLTGAGLNTLTLDVLDLLHLSGSTSTLYVRGDAGDAVVSAGQGWTADGIVNEGGVIYEKFIITNSAAILLVQSGVTTNIN